MTRGNNFLEQNMQKAVFFCWRLLGWIPGGAFSQLSSGVKDAIHQDGKLSFHKNMKRPLKQHTKQKGVKQGRPQKRAPVMSVRQPLCHSLSCFACSQWRTREKFPSAHPTGAERPKRRGLCKSDGGSHSGAADV